MITKQFDFSKKYDLTQEFLKIDRSIFNKCWKIPNFTLFKEMPPEIVLSSDGKYHNENCGYVIFKKKQQYCILYLRKRYTIWEINLNSNLEM